MRIWIDLTNSPHVLVMRPVIERLRADGHDVRVTARDFAQTLELCERLGIAHTAIGHHRGERLAAKAVGLAIALGRARALGAARRRAAGAALRHRPRPRLQRRDASRPAMLRIPSTTMFDYEWAAVQHHVNCRLARAVVVPDAIPRERLERYGARGKLRAIRGPEGGVLPGGLRAGHGGAGQLGLDRDRTIVVVRTPPEVSLYHRFENDLFAGVLARLRGGRCARTACSRSCCRAWPPSARSCSGVPGFVVPEHAIDAQSLIAYADLVISAGGTMNREAVALGTPVYTTFRAVSARSTSG